MFHKLPVRKKSRQIVVNENSGLVQFFVIKDNWQASIRQSVTDQFQVIESNLPWGMVLYGEEEEEMMANSQDPIIQTIWNQKIEGIFKKTDIWLHLISFECIWMHLTVQGVCIWIHLSVFWLHVNVFDSIWLYLITFDCTCLHLNVFDHIWIYLTVLVYIWMCLIVFVYIWLYLTAFDRIRQHLTVFEYTWSY